MSIDLSIVIPAFNEAERIPATLERTDRHVRTLVAARWISTYEILVVDDGSSDDTRAVVEAMTEELPAVRCIRYEHNRGKGHAVRVGMLASLGAIRLMTDADGSIPPEEMAKLLAVVRAGDADVAIGSRYLDDSSVTVKQPGWRVAWSRLCNAVIQRTLVGGIRDTQCGFKAFSADAARELFGQARIDGWAFDLEVLALARQAHMRVVEVGVAWEDDPRSRVNPVKDFVNVLREYLKIRQNLRHGVYHSRELATVSATLAKP